MTTSTDDMDMTSTDVTTLDQEDQEKKVGRIPKKSYTSRDGKIKSVSQLNIQFYDLWTEMFPFIPIKAEVNIKSMLKDQDLSRFHHLEESDIEEIASRRFLADFFIPPNLIVEIQGGTFTKGGHTTGQGIHRDANKHLLYTLLNFRCVYLVKAMINSNELALIERVYAFLNPDKERKYELPMYTVNLRTQGTYKYRKNKAPKKVKKS